MMEQMYWAQVMPPRSPMALVAGSLNKPNMDNGENNGRNEELACAEEPDMAIASLQSDLPSFLPSRRKNH
jgi:hypothetical protein